MSGLRVRQKNSNWFSELNSSEWRRSFDFRVLDDIKRGGWDSPLKNDGRAGVGRIPASASPFWAFCHAGSYIASPTTAARWQELIAVRSSRTHLTGKPRERMTLSLSLFNLRLVLLIHTVMARKRMERERVIGSFFLSRLPRAAQSNGEKKRGGDSLILSFFSYRLTAHSNDQKECGRKRW